MHDAIHNTKLSKTSDFEKRVHFLRDVKLNQKPDIAKNDMTGAFGRDEDIRAPENDIAKKYTYKKPPVTHKKTILELKQGAKMDLFEKSFIMK
jgi:hypothetical protein